MIDKSAFVHPTAIVEEGASIGANAHIGPFCIVGPHVEIGEGTVLKSHVVVNGHTKIGRDNEIYQFASIGEVNQDLKYAGEPTRVEIGDRNRIRESVTIHRGTVQGGGLTKVGSDNLLMINAHIAHDCTVGNRCILANNATLAGHVSVDDFAIIGGMTAVHQFCIIGAHVMVGGCSGVAQDVPPYVEIGEGTVLKSHVVVNGHTKIGRDNEIYQFASIGEVNQDLKYAGEPTRVEIGDRNRIRESVTIHRGTVQGGGLTKVGSDNLLMINAHIAHDCTVGNRCILANNATLAGHVSVDDFAIIGGMTAVHQFCIIGAHVMVGGCSGVAQDVPPYVIAQGNHATPFGVNIEGLKRRGFSREAITAIRNAYKLIYRSGKTLDEVKPEIAELAETYPEVKAFTDFFARSTRGLIR